MHDGRAKCKTCPYAEPIYEEYDSGMEKSGSYQCRYMPPQLVFTPRQVFSNFPTMRDSDWCAQHPLFSPAKPTEPEPPKCRCGETAKEIPQNVEQSFWWCPKCDIKIGQPFKRNPDATVTHARA